LSPAICQRTGKSAARNQNLIGAGIARQELRGTFFGASNGYCRHPALGKLHFKAGESRLFGLHTGCEAIHEFSHLGLHFLDGAVGV
jgi:hypothetical protein